MKIFPHIIARIGGNAFNEIELPSPDRLREKIDQLNKLTGEQLTAKQQLSEQLLAFNQSVTERQHQNTIQNFRRDLYNDRPLKPSVLSKLEEILTTELMGEVNRYLSEYIHQKQNLRDEIQKEYHLALSAARRHLQELGENENLKKGFVLSSLDLLNSLKHYTRTETSRFKRKELMIEQSMYKYAIRSSAKTSPFSTFNNLSQTRIVPSEKPVSYSLNSEWGSSVVSHVRLNNNMYRYLKNLLPKVPAVLMETNVQKNPTIEPEGKNFLYLTNHNNVEAFQRMTVDPVNQIVLEVLTNAADGMVFADLVKKIKERVAAPDESIIGYIKGLVSYGFIEYNFPVSGATPEWDYKLVEYLEARFGGKYDYINELVDSLKSIRQKAKEYETAGVEQRQALLEEAYDRFRNTCKNLHDAAGIEFYDRESATKQAAAQKEMPPPTEQPEPEKKNEPEEIVFEHKISHFFNFRKEQLIYEETSRQVSIEFGEQAINNFMNTFEALIIELSEFNTKLAEQQKMKDYFINKYGEYGTVSLMRYYEDYYKELKKPEEQLKKQKQPASAAAVAGTDGAASPGQANAPAEAAQQPFREYPALDAMYAEWRKTFAGIFEASPGDIKQGVSLSLEQFQQANRGLGIENKMSYNSHGAFFQFFVENDANGKPVLKGVLNNLFPGYGKVIGRFLHTFDPEVTEDLKKWNQELAGDKLYLENCDGSYFNANIHPSTMGFEIQAPGSNNSLDASRQVRITDLVVRYDKEKDQIHLLHKQLNKTVYVFDMGLQARHGRSRLYQLLCKFNDVDEIGVFSIVQYFYELWLEKNQRSYRDGKMLVMPRVTYEGIIVLQRKHWLIYGSQVPQRDPQMSDFEYFLLINQWRTELEIPDEVFLNINYSRTPRGELQTVNGKKPGKDDHKPIYINFLNPVSLLVFERAISKVVRRVKIEEMLPASNQLATIEGQKMVTEFVVQWYRFKQ